MLDWESRYIHELDTRNAQMLSNGQGIPPPVESEWGTHKVVEGIFRSFHGAEFHKEFQKLGHTDPEWDRCQCREWSEEKFNSRRF